MWQALLAVEVWSRVLCYKFTDVCEALNVAIFTDGFVAYGLTTEVETLRASETTART
jgi:hypothetical protein